MSVDRLQEKIRKLKNPSVIDFSVLPEHIPPHLMEEEGAFLPAYSRFCTELMDTLLDTVPAVRFSFGYFALLGPSGLELLAKLSNMAHQQGYYVFLDGPESLSAQTAQMTAEALFSDSCGWYFDGLILSSYIGSDGIKPYVERFGNNDKSIFVVLRTANRSAPELQDLLTGSRLVHMAAADIVNRLAESRIGRSGYSRIGGVAGASSAHSLQSLRGKYNRIFLFLDGYDYTNSNAKNCAEAFDNLGHGAIACAGGSVTAAYLSDEAESLDYLNCAQRAAERMKKNLTRYVTIL